MRVSGQPVRGPAGPGLASLLALLVLWGGAGPAAAADERPGLTPCWVAGLENQAFCGSVRRPLDPLQPAGVMIDVHFAVLPSLARNRKPDPVFLLAGGPGQSAIELAGSAVRLLSRLGNRRDLVLVDQRGTGKSAPLACAEIVPTAPLFEVFDPVRQMQRLADCRGSLQKLPYGDLRHYTTWVAMQDLDAVRQALGAEQINLVGASYGTRAALEYLRQFPTRVRRAVLDGVAPPDMVLPVASSSDNQVALDAVLKACEIETPCQQRYPALRQDWKRLLSSLPRDVQVIHPVTGVPEKLGLTRDLLLALVRAPLYSPAMAAGLPMALHEAAQGRLGPLLGLASALGGRRLGRIHEGMHFAVVCSEDLPRLALSTDSPGADFADSFSRLYREVCAGWPGGPVPAAFYTVPVAAAPVLLLSGGADPVTPPRHAQRTAQALGAAARHVVVPQAGHGVLGLPCMRDVLFRFVDATDDAQALAVAADCALGIPRPQAFLPLVPAGAKVGGGGQTPPPGERR